MPNEVLTKAREFAAELTQTVQGVLPNTPQLQAMVINKSQVTVSAFREGTIQKLPLYIDGDHVADWKLTMQIVFDSSRTYLKVARSGFTLYALQDRTPLLRYEFDDAMHSAPVAHWQFHAERGAFSHLLGYALAAGKPVKPYSLSSLHFPVGGARMRPGVEDLLEFLVRECHFDTVRGWQKAISASRERYRVIQAQTIARDMQKVVAEVLRDQGWGNITPPPKIDPPSEKLLHRW